jgi:group I intron endonuclease
MPASVYLITNLLNEKLYVGKAIKPVNRWSVHCYQAKKAHPRCLISRAIKKYGSENFKFEVLEVFDTEDEAFWWESWWIQYLGTRIYGYNLNYGGVGGASVSEATREILSKANKGRKMSPEAKANHASAMRGSKQTPEHIAKRVAHRLGVSLSVETKAKISASRKAKHAASLVLSTLLITHVSPAVECTADSICVPSADMQSIVTVLQEKQCLSRELPQFNLDPITIVMDNDGRVYYSGADPKPYTLKMKWCNFEIQGEGKLNVIVAKTEPPVWGFRFRPKFAGSFLFVDAFKQSSAGEAVDVGILWDFLYYKSFNVNVATGFRSAGVGVGYDLTRNFGAYAGWAFSWWTLKQNPQAGLYFSFW